MSRSHFIKAKRCEYRAFKIWIAKLGYKVKPMKQDGFYFIFGKEKGYMTDSYKFCPLAKTLMKEFLEYLKGE